MPYTPKWKTDNYKFVGKAFDIAYANRLNKLAPILGTVSTNSVDYELESTEGYGELPKYDGTNLNQGGAKRGFKTIVVPDEFSLSIPVKYKQAKVDKSGACKRVGTKLGASAGMTVYINGLRCLAGAFDPTRLGGDDKPWAATDHPIASKGSSGRKFIPDPEAGTYSNLFSKNLTVTSITEMKSYGSRIKTPDGLPFLGEYDTLLVSPELEATAKKICGEDSKLYPDQVDNVNPVGKELNYIVIGGGDDGFAKNQWALCDRKLMKELFVLVYITKPMVVPSDMENPFIDMYNAYTDFGYGWGDARQILFSDPS